MSIAKAKTKDYKTKKFSDIKYKVDALNLNPEMTFEVESANQRILAQRHAKKLEKSGKLKRQISTKALLFTKGPKRGEPTGKFAVFSI